MPELEKGLFTSGDQLQAADWASVFTCSFEKQAVEELFETHGWVGEATSVVGLRLSPDNTRVASARLILAGAWGEGPVTVQAQKIWPTAAEHLVLEVSIGDMSIFRFPEGEMASNYLSGDITKYVVKSMGQDGSTRPVEEAEYAILGIGDFSLRVNCVLAKSTSVKYGVWLTTTILVFPGTVASLVDKSALAHKASWPGIKLAEGDISLRLQAGRSREAMKGKSWGCPVAPAIIPGVPWVAAPGPLEGSEVRRAIGALLNEGVVPDTSLSADMVGKKWEKLVRAPGDMKPKKPGLTWPTERKPVEKGKITKGIHVNN